MTTIELSDTTLRDGAQSEGISFSVSDKLKISEKKCDVCFSYVIRRACLSDTNGGTDSSYGVMDTIPDEPYTYGRSTLCFSIFRIGIDEWQWSLFCHGCRCKRCKL